MKRWSLRSRMLLFSASATLVALIIAGWFVAASLEHVVTEGLDQRLDAQLAMMTIAVRDDGSVDRERLERRLSLLQGRRGWHWRIAGPSGTIGSADFPALASPPPRPHHDPRDPAPGAPKGPEPRDGEDASGRIHARQTVIQTNKGPVTLIAAAPSEVIARPIRAALVPLLILIASLAAIFAMAALFQLRFGLRPVFTLRDQVEDIRKGARTMVDEDQPAELKPLAAELNALASENAAALTVARASAANLAHALKTPVATLALTVEDNAAAAAQVERIERVIRHHLARARTAAVACRATTTIAPVVADVVDVVGRLRRDVDVRVDVPADLAVSLDAHDLSEIVGNLIDNAARHARTLVNITAFHDSRRIIMEIEDDGPGIPASKREQAMQPGIRLDESPQGDGFGLAIVRDLIALHGGELSLGEGARGGLYVRMSMIPAAGAVRAARTALHEM